MKHENLNHITHHAAERAKNALPPLAFVMMALVLVAPAQADITNSAVARGTYATPDDTTSGPSVVNVPVTTGAPSLNITKAASDTTDVVAGQVITYTYTVVNNGTVSINGISIGDVHNGAGSDPTPAGETLSADNGVNGDSTDAASDGTWDSLAPGDIITFTSTYTVQQTDVDLLQ
jgi:large repetitive protein